MTKSCVLILSFILLHNTIFCQAELPTACDTIISKSTMRHTGFEPTLKDFIISRIIADSGFVEHLISQKKLENEFTLWFCNNEKAVLMYEISRDSNLEIDLINCKKKDEDIKIEKRRRYSPFGKEEGVDSQEIISSITLSIGEKMHEIPSRAFDDLFSPNLCEVYLPMKPIQAFLSNDHQYVYLYICGKVKYKNEAAAYDGFRKSYLAKIVISLKEGYITTIVVPGLILELYNWISCPIDFNGF